MSNLESKEEMKKLDANFWKPSQEIVETMTKVVEEKQYKQILELTDTPQVQVFPLSTRRLIWFNCIPKMIAPDNDYLYIRHALEYMNNPQDFLEEIKKSVSRGYLETISPFVEVTRGMYQNAPFRGHLYSKYIIWSSPEDHVLHILPKSVLLEYTNFDSKLEQEIYDALANVPYYWNCYYVWDEEHPLRWVFYQHGVNLDLNVGYSEMLRKALEESVRSTNQFLMYINDKRTTIKDNSNDSVSTSS